MISPKVPRLSWISIDPLEKLELGCTCIKNSFSLCLVQLFIHSGVFYTSLGKIKYKWNITTSAEINLPVPHMHFFFNLICFHFTCQRQFPLPPPSLAPFITLYVTISVEKKSVYIFPLI